MRERRYVEDKNEQILSLQIDQDLFTHVRQHCYKNGIKIKYFIAEACRKELNGKKSTK